MPSAATVTQPYALHRTVAPASAPPDPRNIDRSVAALERLGFNVHIFSMRRPRESFAHESVGRIQARADYEAKYGRRKTDEPAPAATVSAVEAPVAATPQELAALVIRDPGGVKRHDAASVEQQGVQFEAAPVVQPWRDVQLLRILLVEVDLAAAPHVLIPGRCGTSGLRRPKKRQRGRGYEEMPAREFHSPALL
jgi:hypothetical protein